MTDPSALLGTWKMVSWQREVLATGEQFDALGPDPVGFQLRAGRSNVRNRHSKGPGGTCRAGAL